MFLIQKRVYCKEGSVLQYETKKRVGGNSHSFKYTKQGKVVSSSTVKKIELFIVGLIIGLRDVVSTLYRGIQKRGREHHAKLAGDYVPASTPYDELGFNGERLIALSSGDATVGMTNMVFKRIVKDIEELEEGNEWKISQEVRRIRRMSIESIYEYYFDHLSVEKLSREEELKRLRGVQIQITQLGLGRNA